MTINNTSIIMTSREQLICTLNHKSPDRLCVDMGAGGQTGIGAISLDHLNQVLLPGYNEKVKIIEPYQMLDEVEEPLRGKLQLVVVGVPGLTLPFGTPEKVYREVRERIDIFSEDSVSKR